MYPSRERRSRAFLTVVRLVENWAHSSCSEGMRAPTDQIPWWIYPRNRSLNAW
jgi:hypothetical protein